MNIEFHYYIVKYLALKSGFTADEAEIIAYSSQHIDDNSKIYKVKKPDNSFYENYITQTMNLFKPERKLMRMYILFHFLPGDPFNANVRRKDGKMHILMTSKASTHATEIFFDTTRSENLFSLGIASHMLADTYSHQNFVGTYDEINAFSGLYEKLAPNIGHADAGYKPDIPNLIWYDPRLIEENATINNKERVLSAAKKLYRNFLLVTADSNKWSEVKENLKKAIGPQINENKLNLEKQQKKRIHAYKELLNEYGDDNDYDEYKWFRQAINEDVKFLSDRRYKFDPVKDKFSFKDKYKNTNWFKFQEAVKDYQRIATNKLKPILEQMEIKEW